MAVIRSRRIGGLTTTTTTTSVFGSHGGSGGGTGISRVKRSLSGKGSRLLARQRQRPQQQQKTRRRRSSCLGVVIIFLALVVLAVVATVHTSLLRGGGAAGGAGGPSSLNNYTGGGVGGTIRRQQKPEPIQQQQQQQTEPEDDNNNNNQKERRQLDELAYDTDDNGAPFHDQEKGQQQQQAEGPNNNVLHGSSAKEDESSSADRIEAPRDHFINEPATTTEEEESEAAAGADEEEEAEAQAEAEADVIVVEEQQQQPSENSLEDLVENIEEELIEEERDAGEDVTTKEEEDHVREEAVELAKAEQAMEAVPEESTTTTTSQEEQEHPEDEQEEELPLHHGPEKPQMQFCDFFRQRQVEMHSPTLGFANPAIIVLGMEDTSTELVWHVISQILYPDIKSHRTYQLITHATAIDYAALSRADLQPPQQQQQQQPSTTTGQQQQHDFWNNVSPKSHGKWLAHVLCQQESHNLATGFSWITSPDLITRNDKAKDTLYLIKDSFPMGSVKIIRIRRNFLDLMIRQTQLLQQQHQLPATTTTATTTSRDQTTNHHNHNSQDQHHHQVKLDFKTVLSQLRKLKEEQDFVDAFLVNSRIPHVMLDFETLFPFEHWTDMVQVAQGAQAHPNHINYDDNTATKSTRSVERAWRKIVDFVGITKPLSLFDILKYAMRTHKVNTFWIQRDIVEQYPRLEVLLQGTKYQKSLRKQDLHLLHDGGWGEGDEM